MIAESLERTLLLWFGVVIAGQNESIAQSLVNAEHLDSPRDAAPGTYIAIVEGGHTLVSQDAPKGFPDESMRAQVSRDGRAAEATKTFAGRDVAVRRRARADPMKEGPPTASLFAVNQ